MFHTMTFLLYVSFWFLDMKDMMTSCLSLWSNLMFRITRISKHYLGLLEPTEVGQQITFAWCLHSSGKKKKNHSFSSFCKNTSPTFSSSFSSFHLKLIRMATPPLYQHRYLFKLAIINSLQCDEYRTLSHKAY